MDEQLMDLVGQHVVLFGVPADEINHLKTLTIEQDYKYWLDWIMFTSEDVVQVIGNTIYFSDAMIDSLLDSIDAIHLKGNGRQPPHPLDIPDWIRYADHEPPLDPYDPI